MYVIFAKSFKKDYQNLPQKHKKAFEKRLALFLSNPRAAILNNHKLHGPYSGYRSINITGDIRAIFYFQDDETAIFVRIGSHAELY